MEHLESKNNNQDRTRFKRFTKSEWNKIEKKYNDPIMDTVLDTMSQLGNNTLNFDSNSRLKICNDEIYLKIRPILVDFGLLHHNIPVPITTVPKNKKKPQKMNKNEIIMKNTMENITRALSDTLKTFSFSKLNCSYGFNSQYAVIKIITFMYCAKFLLDSKCVNMAKCYELIMGIKKTIHNISKIEGLSKIIHDDLSEYCDKLIAYSGFTYGEMFKEYPKLCLMTIYDTVFPDMSIKPYESQKKLMEEIESGDGGLYLYKAMIGSGKTTFCIALAEYVNKIRIINHGSNKKGTSVESDLQLIFTCSIEPVRHQVCRMAYNQEIPFGITEREHDVVKIINNYSCNDKKRLLIVADLDSTIDLLKKSQNYILFLDEPTVGADQKNNPMTKSVAKIIALAPKKTILCSATLPELDEIVPIVDHYKSRFPTANIKSICSKESLIGCEIINFDGSIVAPHNHCKSCGELKKIVDNLVQKPFIDRLYTAPIVYKLREKMTMMNIPNLIDLESFFSDVQMLSQSNIQKAGISLLEALLSTGSDELVEQICAPLEEDNLQHNDSEDNIVWEDVEDSKNAYNLDHIFTSEAHKYLGCCLVTVKDPIQFAYEKSRLLLENCDSASKLIARYKNIKEKFLSCIQKLENIKNEDERSKKEQEIYNEYNPTINFPDDLKINTRQHHQKYAHHIKMSKSDFRYHYSLEDLPLDCNVQDWVMLLLFAGVGIYSSKMDENYTETIMNMATCGKLAFLISDDSISYGTNYPFNHVIIDEEVAKEHSIGTIFQLIGRAGRVGQSWVAYAHIGNYSSQRIMNYIKGDESLGLSEEGKNMLESFENAVKELKIEHKPIVKLSDIKPKIDNNNIKNKNKNNRGGWKVVRRNR